MSECPRKVKSGKDITKPIIIRSSINDVFHTINLSFKGTSSCVKVFATTTIHIQSTIFSETYFGIFGERSIFLQSFQIIFDRTQSLPFVFINVIFNERLISPI